MTMHVNARTLELPLQLRREPVARNSVNLEARTASLVFSTGATVRRSRWVGWDRVPYDETIVVSDRAINMERLRAGAPVLDSHSAWSTHSQVAKVERAWVEGGKAMADVRFPAAGIDENADRMFGLVADGIVVNVSVGYSMDEVRVVEPEKKGEVERWMVERWTPHEISFVTIPADPGAQVRALELGAGEARSFPTAVTFEGRAGAGLAARARMRMRAFAASLRV